MCGAFHPAARCDSLLEPLLDGINSSDLLGASVPRLSFGLRASQCEILWVFSSGLTKLPR